MRKGISAGINLIIGLIALLFVAAILFRVFQIGGQELERTENVNAVRTWVLLQAAEQKVSFAERAGTQRPSVPDLGGQIEVKNAEDLKNVHERIAKAMVDCANAFHKGEVNFLQALFAKRFCYPCVPIMVDESLKNKGYKITGLYSWLASHKTRLGPNAPTFLEYLTGQREVVEGIDDTIDVDDNLYVFFYADAGRTAGQFTLQVIGETVPFADLLVGEDDAGVEAAMGAAFQYGYASHKLRSVEKGLEDPTFREVKKEVDAARVKLTEVDDQYRKADDALTKAKDQLAQATDEAKVKLQQDVTRLEGEVARYKTAKDAAGVDLERIDQKYAPARRKLFAEAQAATTSTPTSAEPPKALVDDLEYNKKQLAAAESRLKARTYTAGQLAEVEQDVAKYQKNVVALEKEVSLATSKVSFQSTEKGILAVSERAIIKEAGKAEVVTGKRLLKKVGVKFLLRPGLKLAGKVTMIGGTYLAVKNLFFGNRKYAPHFIIDNTQTINELCTAEPYEDLPGTAEPPAVSITELVTGTPPII